MDNTIKAKDIKDMLDSWIALGMKASATETLNKFGHYLPVTDIEKYIKKISKMN